MSAMPVTVSEHLVTLRQNLLKKKGVLWSAHAKSGNFSDESEWTDSIYTMLLIYISSKRDFAIKK